MMSIVQWKRTSCGLHYGHWSQAKERADLLLVVGLLHYKGFTSQ